MSDEAAPDRSRLPLDVLDRIDRACDRFEAAWARGERPCAEEFLGAVEPAHRRPLLRDLLAAEIAARLHRGERPDPAEYHARFPDDRAAVGAAFAAAPGRFELTRPTSAADEAAGPAGRPGRDDPGRTEARSHPADAGPLPPGTGVRYFGDYEIRRELGRGGMGVVYEARQVSLNRPVALKLVRAGLLAGDDELRRFRNEAEAVALLDHPAIVPVYEVGRHEGQHFLSMKLVPGSNLVPLLDRHRDDPRAAARLAAEAAEAVAHAHARGILHRDLKPANILVDAEGHPHVTDFGLAKKVEADVELTQSGTILGTPAYMSPEQAHGHRGGISTATDVYGLGAVLYALLTGKAPFGGDSVVETIDAVRNNPPEPPRTLNPKLPRDLETICLKCLEKDPRRRYSTVQALADDLRAWLGSRPIAARRVGPMERAWLWCRRRPAVAALSATVLLALLGGTTATIAVQYAANRALDRKNAELLRANARVRQRYDLAVDAIKTFHTGVSEDFLLKQDQFKNLRDRLLNSAADFYGKLSGLLGGETDFASRRALAASNFVLAELTMKVGRLEDALKALREVLASQEALAAEPGADPETNADVAQTLWAIAQSQEAIGKTVEAEATYRTAVARLEAPAASSPAVRSGLGRCRAGLGWLLCARGDSADGLAYLRLGRADQEAVAVTGATKESRHILGDTINRIGVILYGMHRPSEAEAEYRAALAVQQKLADDYPAAADYRSYLALTHANLGYVMIDLGRMSEAEAEFRKALTIQRKVADDYPAVSDYRRLLAMSRVSLGNHLWMRMAGKTSEAEAEMHAAVALQQRLVDENPTVSEYRNQLAFGHYSLAWLLSNNGRLAEAEVEFSKAHALYQKLVDDNPASLTFRHGLAQSRYGLASMLSRAGRLSESEAEYRKVLALDRNQDEKDPVYVTLRCVLSACRTDLSGLLLETGRSSEAEAGLRVDLALLRKLADDKPAVASYRYLLATDYSSLGRLLSEDGRPAESEAEFRKALALWQRLADDYPALAYYQSGLAGNRSHLGYLLSRAGRLSEAEAEFRKALAVHQRLADHIPTDPSYRDAAANDSNNLSFVLRRLRRPAEALEVSARAVATREALLKEHPEAARYRGGLAENHLNRGLARRALGDTAGAAADLRRAVELFDALPSRTGELWFLSACSHAALSGLTGQPGSAAPGAEADAAMTLLRKAAAMGHRDPDAYRVEDALDPLRDREDFRLLIMDLAFPADPFAASREGAR